MRDDGFANLCARIQQRMGVRMDESKRLFAQTRLRKRLTALQLPDIDAYSAYVLSNEAEFQLCVECLVTHHTQFFREASHFPALTNVLDVASNNAKIWCAACSSGEEAYTLGIVLQEWAHAQPGRTFELHASDVSERVLAAAQTGVYTLDKVDLPNKDLLAKYFQKGIGSQTGKCRVKAHLRRTVSFYQHNLLDTPAAGLAQAAPFDVVFCRNVLIYFDTPTQRRVVDHLLGTLVPGGHLFVGHSEHVNSQHHKVATLGGGVYKKQ